MRVAIIGGGYLGLSSAVFLVQKGFKVDIYEKCSDLGGLAASFNPGYFSWNLEKYYHHIFQNDHDIINFAKFLDVPLFFSKPDTSCYIDGEQLKLDDPNSLLSFKPLPFFSRIQTGFGLAILKLLKNGKFLEKITCANSLPYIMGKKSYEKIWKPLLVAKFGKYHEIVNMAWFWARIYKRTKQLGYIQGGFDALVNAMILFIKKFETNFFYNSSVQNIKIKKNYCYINDKKYDAVLITTPASLIPKVDTQEIGNFPKINYLWGQNLIIELKYKLIDNYWLNILEKNWPFLVVVEHTNFIDRSNYHNNHIIYIGNYLENNDYRLLLAEQELFDLYFPYLKKINIDFKKSWINNFYKFQSPFSQPVFPVNYSQYLPSFKTKFNNVYIANMSMVYPWDRGTNYAIKMANKVSNIICNDFGVT